MNRPRYDTRSNGNGNNNSYRQSSNGGGSGGGYPQQKRSQVDDCNLKKPNWNAANLQPIEKDFYKEHQLVSHRPNGVLDQFMRENAIAVNGDKFINPVLSFEEAVLPQTIMNKIRDNNFSKPTAIQSMCWPILMSGDDLVGIAQTGSGKTLGFILPMLIHIQNQNRNNRDSRGTGDPLALVLAPTRELAQQIQQVAETFGELTGVRNICIYGGSPKGPQIQAIRKGAEICIATPGRLLDFLKENLIRLSKITFLVVDEADRMLDMGFEPQIRKIIEQIRPDRQTAMFSATWPKEVRKLAEDFLSTYTHITIGASELMANPNIKQIVQVCDENDKEAHIRTVLEEIMNYRDSKVIMFAETKRKVDNYSKFIRSLGYHCLTIHGDKKQFEREWVLNEFKGRAKTILVATDVAARGLNIADIKYVINIDYPTATEDYVHRIGRTARSTNTGTAYTFLTPENARHLPKLLDVLRETNQVISDDLLNLSRFGGNRGGSRNNSRGGHNNFQNRAPRPNGNGHGNGHSGGPPQRGSYNGNSMPPRKRDASEMSSNGHHMNGNGDSNGAQRVKKFRWDNNGPQQESNNMNNNRSYNSHMPPTNNLPQLPPPPPPSSKPPQQQNYYSQQMPAYNYNSYNLPYYQPPQPNMSMSQPPPPPPPPTSAWKA